MTGTTFGLLALASLVGGVVRGVAGFGGPLLLMPIVNLLYPPTVTIAAVLLADTIASLQLLPGAWREGTPRVLALLLLGTALAMPAGAALLLWADPTTMKRVISATILALALLVLSGWRYREPLGTWGYTAVGALGGVVMGATGIAAAVPLFLNAGHDTGVQNRAHFILWVFAASLFVCATLLSAGHATEAVWTPMFVLLPSYSIGVFIGGRLLSRVSESALRRGVLCLVVLVAIAGLTL